jgi:hypothetical protein
MKPLLALFIVLALIRSSVAEPQSALGRSIRDVKLIPTPVLQRSISPKFYQSLLVSPIEGWVAVQGNLHGTTLSGLKVVRSEPRGLHDHLALQRAKDVVIAGNFTLASPHIGSSVLVHLLIYRIADGTMALSFASLDGPGGNQQQYFGCARLAVLKESDGKWVEIKGPPGLEGKGLAVRQGLRNDLATSLKLEGLTTGPEATNMGTGR